MFVFKARMPVWQAVVFMYKVFLQNKKIRCMIKLFLGKALGLILMGSKSTL